MLENLKLPQDIKKLSIKELKILAKEVRERIIQTVSNNGGHLSSNLGIVETAIALNYVFDLPTDKIIYDVGHQCYTHKILTGRLNSFSTLRKKGGISGFSSLSESEYDSFTTGHAGSSICAALGYAAARDLVNDDYYVVNVMGDGAMFNGMSLEALSSSNKKPKKFIFILNDNGMSISNNTNGLYTMLSQASAKQRYIKTKKVAKKVFKNSCIAKLLKKIRGAFKRILNSYNFVERLGFKYIGIVDGNDIEKMIDVLNMAKNIEKGVFLHIKTTKGKGYLNAEENSDVYHGIGKNMQVSSSSFSNNLGKTLQQIASTNSKVVAITAGMSLGVGLKEYSRLFSKRFFDVGIQEEYAVTLASGMALGGLKPIVCVYSTFLQRAYDQIMEDICIDNLPVIFCIDRAGVVGADGKTHQGIFTNSYLRHIPNLTILTPKDIYEQTQMLNYALTLNSPVAIIYPNGQNEQAILAEEGKEFSLSTPWEVVKNGQDIVILANGRRMIELAQQVDSKSELDFMIVNARSVNPLDEKMLNLLKRYPIITLEDNVVAGGFGSGVLEYYANKKESVKIMNLGFSKKFVDQGTILEQFEEASLTCNSILDKALDFYKGL